MEKFDATKIPTEQVEKIVAFIEDRRKKHSEEFNVHLNAVLREDIFPLLDRICTVVYFPIKDKENNGFHVSYPFHGDDIHFVYINTAQDKEKQIFTAAHELGHLWALDEYLSAACDVIIDAEYCERIMNRFASELLMPKMIFLECARREIDGLKHEGKITVGEMVEAITAIMNEFFVPYKSVVYRLFELELIAEETARLLWGEDPTLPRYRLEEHSRKVASERGFSRLYKADERRGIEGLKELLDEAKSKKSVPSQWLEKFYDRFEFEYKKEEDGSLNSRLISESGENADA